MGREDRPETMKGLWRTGKDVWRGEEEQSRVGGQLSFQVLKEWSEVFGMWMDGYTYQYRIVRRGFDLMQWINNTQVRSKIEWWIKIPLMCPYRKETF